jgi:hypothetical protein
VSRGFLTNRDPEVTHVADAALLHVQPGAVLAHVVGRAQFGHELRAVESSVVRDDGRELAQSVRKGLHSQGLFALRNGNKNTNTTWK